jgi:hypothetical protein
MPATVENAKMLEEVLNTLAISNYRLLHKAYIIKNQ